MEIIIKQQNQSGVVLGSILFFIAISLILLVQSGCSHKKLLRLKPKNLTAQKSITIEKGNLKVVFAGNSAFGAHHKAGYNGIAELYHKDQDSSVFVPFYAGFNLEHIFGGDSLNPLFEPRKSPMELFRIADDEVLLYQAPTPLSKVESQIRFKVIAPNYIDVEFRFIFHSKDFFKHNYAGLFFASYINAPEDKKIYFRGIKDGKMKPEWVAAFSNKHGVKSTHRWIRDTNKLYFAPNFNATLASHISDYRFLQPFYYGRFHNMALAYMFSPAGNIRFSQSPTGGGAKNPAWDFQFIIPNFKTEHSYVFRARIVYRPSVNKNVLLEEYQTWKDQLEELK